MKRLSALFVKNAKAGRHADGDGLYLLVKPTGGRSWLLRIQVDGQRRDIGLGSAANPARGDKNAVPSPIDIPLLLRRVLTLSEAREKAAMLRIAAKSGLDPTVERDRERRKLPTFKEATIATHEALKDGWNTKSAATFLSSLENHAYPTLGTMRVDQIDASHIRDMLAPIWTEIPDMARKVRYRVGQVLDFAKAKGWRQADAPRKSVTVGLPKQPSGRNFKAMPYAQLPAFVADLRAKTETTGRIALLLQIFTAARPGEVRGARWGQVDFESRLWHRPAELMKGFDAPPHTVTLSAPALSLLDQLLKKRRDPEGLIFPGQRGGLISDMTMNKVIRDLGLSYDAHGFRSSFRDWAAEQMPNIPDPVAEAALAHLVPDKVIRAYKRTTFIEMRRELLEAWGEYLLEKPSHTEC